MPKNFVFPDGAGVAAEMKRAPAFGKVNIGKLIVEAPLKERQNIVEVPLKAIVKDSPFQTRRPFDPDANPKARALVESIDALGQKEPVCLKLIGNGEYETVYGHRRIAVLRYLDRPTVLAIIIKGDLEELATWTAIENTGEPLSPIEKAELADLLEQEFQYTTNEIAVRLGCTAREVYRFKTVLGADEAIRFALQAEMISLRLALALSTGPREHQPRLVEIAIHNRRAISDSLCDELIKHMADAHCSPDDAAGVFGLTLPNDSEPSHAEATWHSEGAEIELAHDADAVAERYPAGEAVEAVATDESRSGEREHPAHEAEAQDLEPSKVKERKPKRSKRPKLALDPNSVSKMLQNEQATAERANLRAVANKGTERGMSVHELRIAALLTHTTTLAKALDHAEALKGDGSARLVAEISERLGRLRDLSSRRGCSGQVASMLQSLSKEISTLVNELKTSKRAGEVRN